MDWRFNYGFPKYIREFRHEPRRLPRKRGNLYRKEDPFMIYYKKSNNIYITLFHKDYVKYSTVFTFICYFIIIICLVYIVVSPIPYLFHNLFLYYHFFFKVSSLAFLSNYLVSPQFLLFCLLSLNFLIDFQFLIFHYFFIFLHLISLLSLLFLLLYYFHYLY